MSTTAGRIGFISALMATVAVVGFDIVQTLQLIGMLYFPMDEFLIYGFSLGIVVPFLLAMLALHYTASGHHRFWSSAALAFTLLYAVFVTANYVVQLATVIPIRVSGHGNEVTLLMQTPHSMFWNFDAIGYICMGLAALTAMNVFDVRKYRGTRKIFMAHALTTPLIILVYFYPAFSDRLLLVGVPWAITAPLMTIALTRYFKMQSKVGNDL